METNSLSYVQYHYEVYLVTRAGEAVLIIVTIQ